MARDKYISMKPFVNGFSFANFGFFYGFGGGVIGAVYALCLMDIFNNSSIVGIYNSLSYGFVMLLALISGEFFRRFTKTKILYFSVLIAGIFSFMMAFSIKPITFIVLDQLSWLPWMLIGYSIPLFLNDFSKKTGIERLSGRYYTWLNIGAFIAPMVAMFFAEIFGNRSAYFIAALVMLIGLFYFRSYHVISEDRPIKKLIPRRTMRSIINNVRLFYKRPELVKAYLVNCGYYALSIILNIYAPIIIISEGFSKGTLGLLLSACVLPYIVMAAPVSILAKKIGNKKLIASGFIMFAVFSFLAIFLHGYALLGTVVALNFAMAIIEPLRDLLFFKSINSAEASRFIGVFNTGDNVPRFIVPLICAFVIFITGATNLVWFVSSVLAVLGAFIMLSPGKQTNQ